MHNEELLRSTSIQLCLCFSAFNTDPYPSLENISRLSILLCFLQTSQTEVLLQGLSSPRNEDPLLLVRDLVARQSLAYTRLCFKIHKIRMVFTKCGKAVPWHPHSKTKNKMNRRTLSLP